jgi:hypothetical protein
MIQSQEKRPNRKKFFLGVYLPLIPVVCAVAPSLLGSSFFWVNDDVGNLLLASGAWSGRPEVLNPFMGAPLTALLAFLYSFAGIIPWYPISILCVPLTTYLYLHRSLAGHVHGIKRLLVVLVASYVMLILGLRINYTYASFVATGMASLGIIARGSVSAPPATRIQRHVVPMTLLLASSSLRLDHALGVVSMSFGAFIAVTLTSVVAAAALGRRIRPAVTRLFSYFLLVVVGLTLCNSIIRELSPEWSEYVSFNNARGAVQSVNIVDDYLARVSPQELEKETGIDRLDLQLLNGFALFNNDWVSTEDLRQLWTRANTTRTALDQLLSLGERTAQTVLSMQFLRHCGIMILLLLLSQAGLRMGVRLLVTASVSLQVLLAILAATRSPDYVVTGIFSTLLLSISVSATLSAVLEAETSSEYPPIERTPYRSNREEATLNVSYTPGGTVLGATSRGRTYVIPLSWVICGSSVFMFFLGATAQVTHALSHRSVVTSVSTPYRQVIREARSYPQIAWVEPLIWGWAYQGSPFSLSIVEEVKHARIVSGGTTLRSPAWTRRFAMLMKGDARDIAPNQLYTQTLLYLVVWSLDDAKFISEQLTTLRNECHIFAESETPNWYAITRSESCAT